MPKIPVYNQGQGSAVKMATGPLSRAVDRSAFTAPGRALSSFAQTAGNIAVEFGLAEKRAETDRVYNEKLTQYSAAADELIANPRSRTVEGFNIESGEFRRKALEDVNGMDSLTKSQKAQITSSLGKVLDRKITVGRGRVFDKQQSERSAIMDKGIEALMSDAADKSMRDVVLKEISDLMASAEQQGLNISYDMKSINYEIDKLDILAESTQENLPLSYHKEKREQILNGEGVYAKYSSAERETLASKVGSRINYLEGEAIAEANSDAKDLAARTLATGDDSGSRELEARLRSLGQFQAAENLAFNTVVNKKVFNEFDAIKMANPTTIATSLREAEQRWRNSTGDQAAENLAIYQKLNEQVTAMKEAIAADPVAYIESVAGETLSPAERVEKQRMLGLQDFQISPFSKSEFNQLKVELENLDAVESIQRLEQFFAPYDGDKEMENMALRQAMKNGMTYAQNIALANPLNPRATDLLNAEKRDQTQIDATLKAMKEDKATIRAAVVGQLDDWSKSVIGGTTDGYLNRMGSAGRLAAVDETQKAVIKLAEVYVTAGMDVSAAAKAAANMITDKYVFQTGRGGSSVRMPSTLSDQSGQIMNVLDQRLFEDKYLEGTVMPNKPDATSEETAQYIKEIRSEGRWITSTDDSGVYLVDKLGNMVLKKVPVNGVMTEMPITINFREAAELVRFQQDIDAEARKPQYTYIEPLVTTPGRERRGAPD